LIATPAWGSSCFPVRFDSPMRASVLTGDRLSTGMHRQIRIAGIRAPEQPPTQSREALARILRQANGLVRMRLILFDHDCTPIAIVSAKDEDVATIMLRDGMAFADVEYLPEELEYTRRFYIETERKAREQRTGLWRLWAPPEQR